jgi:hypothetical protein
VEDNEGNLEGLRDGMCGWRGCRKVFKGELPAT